MIGHQPDIDKFYLYAKDPYEAKYHLLINKQEERGLEHFHDSKDFIEYLNDIMIFIKILKNTIEIRNVKY